MKPLPIICLTLGAFLLSPLAFAEKKGTPEPIARIAVAATVFDEIMAAPDKGIPREFLEDAYCIGVIPAVKRAGFVFGGKYGKGVFVCRMPGSRAWTGPSTVRIEGGSFGFQIGGGETDVVLVVRNARGAEKLMKSKFTLGGDASAMAGPVGRSAEAKTDALMHAEILSWSRSRGLFAGVSLEGATLRDDSDDNAVIYGRKVHHGDILRGKVAAPASARVLATTLSRYSAPHQPKKKSAMQK